MKRTLTFIFILFQITVLAQEDQKVRRLDPNVFFGGNLGLAFGTITNIDVSPYVGYRFFEQQFGLGVGATYQYFSDSNIGYSTSIYGGRVFAQLLPARLSMIILHAEYEGLNFEYYQDGRRKWIFSPLAGGGLRQGSFSLIALWNINGSSEIYTNPMVRIGFTF